MHTLYTKYSKFINKGLHMKCPICNAWGIVLSTRRGIVRRRECANMHRFTTIEILKPDKLVKPKVDKPSKKEKRNEK